MSGYSDIANGSLYAQSMAGFFAKSKSATLDNKARQTLVSRSRILYIESPIARSCVDILTRECVGSGLRYAPNDVSSFFENYKSITGELKTRLNLKSQLHLLEASRRFTFSQFQELIFKTILLSGDCFLIRLEDGSFCIKESDYCFTPTFLSKENEVVYYITEGGERHYVVDGVELDDHSMPVAYWFCNTLYDQSRALERNSWSRIEAFDDDGQPRVLHCAFYERPGQFRGLPLLSSVIEPLWSLSAYLTSETQMALLQVNQSWVITTNTDPTRNPFNGVTKRELDAPLVPTTTSSQPSEDFSLIPPSAEQMYNGAMRKTTFLQPGTSMHLASGEDIKAIAPTAPTNGLKDFVAVVVDQIGAAIGIPSQILTSRIDSNYSSCKAAFAQLQHTVRQYRTMFVESFLKPFFQSFCMDAIEEYGWESQKYSTFEAALLLSNESLWLPSQSQTILEPNREIDFYSKCLELGLVSKDEVANLLFNHDAVGE